MLVLIGGVMQMSAADQTVYLNPNANGVDLRQGDKISLYYFKSSDKTQNGWDEFTEKYNGVYAATLPDGYDMIVITRGTTAKSWDGKHNQSDDLAFDASKPFYTPTAWTQGSYNNLGFSTCAARKIYVQNKSNNTTPKIHTWGGTFNSSYPTGFTLVPESVNGETWYVYVTSDTSVNGLFFLTGNNDKTADIPFNLSSGSAFYFYYPEGSDDKYSPVVRKTVSGTNIYATFSWTDGESNNKGVNFNALPNGVKAYTLTVAGTSISKSAFTATLNKAKGLLLENTTGSDVTLSLPIWNNGNEDDTSNNLFANNATHISQDESGYTKYILALQDNLVGFYKVNTTLGNDMGTNTAYLKVATSGEARASYWFDGETTGINALDNLTNSQMNSNAPMYNLAGQRVNKSYKGVVVVNGKKMLNK